MHFQFEDSVTREDALRLTKEHWHFSPAKEYVPLAAARGCVTAEDIYSENTLPVCRTSPFDGIAVRRSAFGAGIPDPNGWVKGVDYVPADTGDDFPDEFDAIVAVEDIFYDEQGALHFTGTPELITGDDLNQPGSMIQNGALLVAAHTRLTPVQIALLAMGGIHQAPVLRKPRVAFLPTGSELVPAGVKPLRGQNIDSNSLLMAGYLSEWGAEPVSFPIVRDDRESLAKALDKALALADIVLINGGSSKGVEDFNSTLLKERASFFRHGVRAVPGRPVAVSIIEGKPVVNVPGPMLAAWLAADWCASGLIYHYYGLPSPKRATIKARLAAPLKTPGKFEALLRVNLRRDGEGYLAEPVPRKGSIARTANCDGLLVVPIGVDGYNAGDEVEIKLLKGIEYFV